MDRLNAEKNKILKQKAMYALKRLLSLRSNFRKLQSKVKRDQTKRILRRMGRLSLELVVGTRDDKIRNLRSQIALYEEGHQDSD